MEQSNDVVRNDQKPDIASQKKKLIKDAEKAQKKVAKERERLIKQQEKQEELRKKQEEKEKILNEKRLKKEQEEKEKEEKRKQKDEEKRLRDQKREEEEQKKEEIRKEEAEKERIKNKQKALFTSFFIKKEGPDEKPPKVEASSVSVSKLFMQFELKKDMMISPVNRVSEEERRTKSRNLDSISYCSNLSNYLSDIKSSQYKAGRSKATWPFETPELQIIKPKPSTSSGPSTPYSKWMKAKFLQFVENYRPAYYGTWRKSSKTIHSRKPFVQDSRYFDYEVDSDDEWEEEEPGENISHSEGENEEEEEEGVVNGDDDDDDDEENDGFFVPHGYLSDDEGAEAEDEDVTPEMRKIRQQLEEKQYELGQKKKIQPLRPVINGVRFLSDDEEDDDDLLRQYKMHVWTQLPIKCSIQEMQLTATPLTKSPKRKDVPPEALVHLAQFLNKNPLSFSKLAYEFRMFWQKLKSGVLPEVSYEEDKKGQSWGLLEISKSQLKTQVKKMASYDGSCWVLLPEILEMYSAENNIHEPWSYVTDMNQKPNKVVNSSAKKVDKSKRKELIDTGASDPVTSPSKFMKKLSEPSTPSKQHVSILSSCNNNQSGTSESSESKPQKRLYITNFFTPAISPPPSKKCKTLNQSNDSTRENNPVNEVEVIVIDA